MMTIISTQEVLQIPGVLFTKKKNKTMCALLCIFKKPVTATKKHSETWCMCDVSLPRFNMQND